MRSVISGVSVQVIDMSDWRVKQGKQLEKEIGFSLKYLSEKWKKFWYMRLMDYKSYYQINPNLHAQKQPADFIAVCLGKVHFLEAKSSSAKNRYGLQYVQEHQKESLLAIEQAGGFGWILLSWRRWNHSPRHPNRLFAFRIGDWLKLEKETLDEGFKSVTWNRVIGRGIDIPRKKGVWDLRKVFIG